MHQQLHTTLWHTQLYSPSCEVHCTKACCKCMYDTSHSATEAICFKENGSLIGSRRTGTANFVSWENPVYWMEGNNGRNRVHVTNVSHGPDMLEYLPNIRSHTQITEGFLWYRTVVHKDTLECIQSQNP